MISGQCPRCFKFGELHEVQTPVAKVHVCEGCARERAMAMSEERNAKALKRGGCLRCGKPHAVCDKPEYINGFCLKCATDFIIESGL